MTQLHRDLVLQGLSRLVNDASVEAEKQDNGAYKVEIETTSETMAMSLEVLRLVMTVAGRVYQSIDRAHVRALADAKVEALRAKERAVAEQYWIYREQGMAHRIAIDCTVQISEVCQQMQWTKTDVWHCVKAFPREMLALNPKPKEVGHETECEG